MRESSVYLVTEFGQWFSMIRCQPKRAAGEIGAAVLILTVFLLLACWR